MTVKEKADREREARFQRLRDALEAIRYTIAEAEYQKLLEAINELEEGK